MKNAFLIVLMLSPLAMALAADTLQHTPASPLMLSGPWLPENPHHLDFHTLPKVPCEHAVISDVRAKRKNDPTKLDKQSGDVNQHTASYSPRCFILSADVTSTIRTLSNTRTAC